MAHWRIAARLQRFVALPLAAVLISGLSLFAQETGTILGSVTDQSGASVPNAKITITNPSNGTERTTMSNSEGNYTVTNLNIGNYTVKAESPGFKSYEQAGIVLNVNATVRINIGLQIGQSQESITVEANAIQVQTDTSEQSQMITSTQISNLDTNGRNPIQLATLVPGAASALPDFNAPTALSSNNDISFNGQRPQHNIWRIDGGESYDRGSGGGMIVSPSPDAISEFRVMTSNYSAEFGSASGGTISMAIKSGTKDFHGNAWEFFRNDALNTNNYFGNLAGTPIPKLRYNAFGFNIGGPVIIPKIYNKQRSKTQFFYNQEWRRLIQGSQIFVPAVPQSVQKGNFGSSAIHLPNQPSVPYANNQIPLNQISPNALAFLGTGVFPNPNAPNNQYSQASAVPTYLREEIVRIDHQFSDKIAVMGHLIYDSSSNQYATTLWNTSTYPTLGTNLLAPSYSSVIRMTYTISPTVVNELSYNFNGNKLNINPTGIYQRPSGFNVPELYPANALNRLPVININQPYNIAYNPGSWPWKNVYSANQITDNVSVTRGNHNMVFGGSYLYGKKDQDIFGNTNGSFTFDGSATGNAFADFLTGYAQSYSELNIQDSEQTRFQNFAFYAVDNWHASKKLTLNLGLRYEGMPHAYDINNRLANFQPDLYNRALAPIFNGGSISTATPASALTTSNGATFYTNGLALAGQNGVPKGLVNNTWNNWGPRVGFAYDVTGQGKTVIRSGFGMFYERVQGNDIYNMGGNPPFSGTGTLNNVLLSNPAIGWNGVQLSTPIVPSGLTTLARTDYKLPTSMQYSFGIQQQLSRAATLDISYVGASNYHQPVVRNINSLNINDPNRLAVCGGNCNYSGPNANLNPNPYRIFPGYGTIVQTEAATGSNYNSLQVSTRWQNKAGLTLQGAYTYSHALDYQSADLNTVSNPFNRRYDYGSGDFDRRHIAIISYTYDLPFFRDRNSNAALKLIAGGWSVSGITIFQTGRPLTVTASTDKLGLGGSTTSRANLVAPVQYGGTGLTYFNTSSFADPANLQFGTSARGQLVGPGRQNWNIALFKTFHLPFTETTNIQFRAESYNTFNHTQWNQVSTQVGSTNFGNYTSTFDPRVLQLSLRVGF